MPRMAATRTSNRSYRRSKPLGGAIQAPVLFRFPNIEIPTDSGEEESRAEPTAHVSASPSPAVPAEPEVVAQPLATVPAPVSDVVTAYSDPQRATSEPATETESERSWWEHWSSGVVLVLLIIALVVASIIAFGDAGSSDPDLLASKPGGEFEATVLIPSIEPTDAAASTPEVTADTSQGAPRQTQQPAATKTDPIAERTVISPPTLSAANPQATDQASPAAATFPQPSTLQTSTTEASEAAALLQGLAPNQEETEADETVSLIDLALEEPQIDGSFAESTTTPAQSASETRDVAATANLHPPIAAPQQSPFPTMDQPSSQSNPVQATPVSSSSESSDESGKSPSLYDGASNAESVDVNSDVAFTPRVSAPPAGNIESAQQQNLPAIPALLTSGTQQQNLVDQSDANDSVTVPAKAPASSTSPPSIAPQSQPVTATTKPTPSAGGPTTTTANPAGPVLTSTPEMDQDAIIRAFQRFNEMKRQSQQPSSNRYMQSGVTPAR